MGGGCTHYEQSYEDAYGLQLYQETSNYPCILPDIGLDEAMLKYSGANSNNELQAYSHEMLDKLPGYITSVGKALGGLTPVPNAVGMAAMVISMVVELIINSSTKKPTESSYSMLQRVFAEEKASSVRDVMIEYLKRHRMYIREDQRLLEEIRRLEAQLSLDLTRVRDSMLFDNQMTSRGFKIWVNGAAFHLQMLIHEARLKVQAGEEISHYVGPIGAAIDVYSQDLDTLLEKYKAYKTSKTELKADKKMICTPPYSRNPGFCVWVKANCLVTNTEMSCEMHHVHHNDDICNGCDMTYYFIHHIFSKYEPILHLKKYFSDLKNDLTSLINQHDEFPVPSNTAALIDSTSNTTVLVEFID